MTEVLKKFQGSTAHMTNTGNLGTLRFGIMTVNTTVKTSIRSIGLTRDQRKPRNEFL